MDAKLRFAVTSRDVVAEDFDGEFVVLDLSTGKYFGLSGGSAIVWRGLLAGHSLTSLCAKLPAGDAKRDAAAALVASFVDHGLLVADPATDPVGPESIAEELMAAAGPFSIDVFDDLQDLILTDPIHDVDQEAGWPHRPTEPNSD